MEAALSGGVKSPWQGRIKLQLKINEWKMFKDNFNNAFTLQTNRVLWPSEYLMKSVAAYTVCLTRLYNL